MKTYDSDDEQLLRQQEAVKPKPKPNWDLFDELPPEKDSDLDEDRTIYNFILRMLKLLTYLVVFAIVLGSSIVSKSLLVLMTSQLRPHETPVPYCHQGYSDNIQFVSTTTPEERISWVWAIFFAFMAPEAQTFLRGLRLLVFKGHEKPTWLQFLLPFTFETLHTIGLALMVYTVFPNLDVIKAVMLTNAFCLLPGILGMFSRGFENNWGIKCAVDVIAIFCQLSALFVWPLIEPHKSTKNHWTLPVSAILISFGWWENFIDESSPFPPMKFLAKMKTKLRRTRYFTYTFISIWKMAVFLLMLAVGTKVNENSWSIAFDLFHEGFDNHTIPVQETRGRIEDQEPSTNVSYLEATTQYVQNQENAVLWMLGFQMAATYICYIFGKLACRICIQVFSYAFPVLLSVPATLTVIISLCGIRNNDVCFWDSAFPGYLWWTCPQGSFWGDYFLNEHAWLWVLWLLSQIWITLHIWYPKGLRLARTESVFATPMYNGFLIDQSLAMNRRRDENFLEMDEDEDIVDDNDRDDGEPMESSHIVVQAYNKQLVQPEDEVPKLIVCATMWHETREEMIEMLKSIMRMDSDQCARRIARTTFDFIDPSYYEFESHIFFDDAFKLSKPDDAESEVEINNFVKDLVSQMEEAATHVHQVFVKLRPPKKIPTPYGGRLEWTLPGRTKLICHLKDKDKIRHKKRWSQVMYMYFLLGYRLTDRDDLALERKEVIAENTFLLALDGDIDFQPSAVELLVDLMKKNRNLGAACGRIHPIGSGPMVWYQKFEYAVGHWFQKATEHVMGCVLCSPGCFSLFRAKALMDYNVMKKYTTMATEPEHYVQYDQGEDRWLCTLLLQRGWRVEYSAASDAKTHAPEGFREFYNQRRRWVPSTMANIMDLLLNGRRTVKQNPDISYPYIIYQIVLLVGTILGPGTIFLMLVGAFAVAFKLDQWSSFMYNFAPILLFILVCFFCKSEIQLAVAEVLTTIYALAMVAVVVAIILQISDDGIMAPSSLFLAIIASSFLIAGMIHPLEFWCLPHGFLYYITIPSMYLLLMIYSLFNLNVVSWGTREGVKTKTKQELEAEQKELEEMAKTAEKQKKKQGLLGFIPGMGAQKDKDGKDVDGSFEISFAGLFKLMCCVKPKPDEQKDKLDRILVGINDNAREMQNLKRLVDKQTTITRRLSIANSGFSSIPEDGEDLDGHAGGSPAETKKEEEEEKEKKIKRNELMNPFWLEDPALDHCEVQFLTGPEIKFWKTMIAKYLKPLEANKQKEKEMADKLKDLKNKTAFTFLMCNAVFVILIFLLQLEKDSVHINWPWGAKMNVTFIPGADEIHVDLEYLELEPIGLVFVGIFGVILAIQFIGMWVHRLGTFLHIMAMTMLDFFNKNTSTIANREETIKEGMGLIRKLQKAQIAEAKKEQRKQKMQNSPGRRKTITHLQKMKNQDRPFTDLQRTFSTNFQSLENNEARRASTIFKSDIHRKTLEALKTRRNSVLEKRNSIVERRASQVFDEPQRPGSMSAFAAGPSSASKMFQKRNSLRFAIPSTSNNSADERDLEEIELDEQ